ncbi:MAG TPA: hypothetical protein VK484_08885 [Ferruginibacter sp.]|nr:hypothetical protein [Ferruginibacter sp.]
MELDFKENIPADFAGDSRVWIYQSGRPFSKTETEEMRNMFSVFVSGWNSHGDKVKGFAGLLFDQFLVLMADESATGVSGCSTDSSVRLIKSIEEKFTVTLFNRQSLAFYLNDKIELVSLDQLEHAVENNLVNGDTLYFNNTVLTKKDMVENWIIPVKKSWLGKRLTIS